MSDDFGPVCEGIQIPETVILPPEVIELLPWMSLAELKITIAAIARLMQVGGAEPITLSEFEQITGLDRKSVLAGIERAMKRGLLMRYEITGYQGHKAFVYELRVFIGGNFPPMSPLKAKLSKDVVDSDSTTDLSLLSLSAPEKFSQKAPENAQKQALLSRLRKVGVYAKTAAKLLQNPDMERVEKFLDLYPLAQRLGRAEGPGWLVKAITDSSWDPEIEQVDLQERLARSEKPSAGDPETALSAPLQQLPGRIHRILRDEIGWNGDTSEVLTAYHADKKRVNAWLKWSAEQSDREFRAARFRIGLRSGEWPPKPHDQSRDYLAGEFSKFLDH